MAIDKSSVDAYGEFWNYTKMTRKATTHGGEWCAPCCLPGCGSQNDALLMWPYRVPDADGNVTQFWCRRCDRHGDIITFVALMDDITDAEAAAKLGLVNSRSGSHPTPPTTIQWDIEEAPSATWMDAAVSFCKECKAILWSDRGVPARDWLHARGFLDATIDACGYGYNPIDRFDDPHEWDIHDPAVKKVWIPRGVIIPWLIGNELWKVSIRRGNKDLRKDEEQGIRPRKYVSIKGSSNGLYRVNTIKSGKPLVLTEGEFNADILAQVLTKASITDVAVTATGGTDKGRADNWLIKIARASPILLSFDPDEGGEEAVREFWRKVFPDNSITWPAWGGDINDMLLTGKDVAKWLEKGIKIATMPPLVVEEPPVKPLAEVEEIDQTPVCSRCHRRDTDPAVNFYYIAEDTYVCESCHNTVTTPPPAQVLPEKEPVLSTSRRELLNLGRRLHYPEMILPYSQIEAGAESWSHFCETAPLSAVQATLIRAQVNNAVAAKVAAKVAQHV